MNNSNVLLIGGMFLLALVGSVFLGEAVAMENYAIVGIFFVSAIALLAVKLLGVNIWVLIPIFITFGGSASLLRLPVSLANLVTFFCVGVMAIQYAVGMIKFRWRMGWIELLLLVCLAGIGVTYLLNPVGLAVLGSSTVGSRPYLEIMVATMAFVFLSGVKVRPDSIKLLPKISLMATCLLTLGMGLAYHFVSVGVKLYPLYSGFAPNTKLDSIYGFQMSERLTYLRPFGRVAQLYAMLRQSAWSLRLSKGGVTVFIMLVTLGSSLLTGHRIVLAMWSAYIIIYVLLLRQVKLLLLMGAGGLLVLSGLYGFHHGVKPLPFSVQRSLSVLPGDWDRDVLHDAEGSIEWRLEMWDAVLFEKGRVNNKIMGDGFGFSSRELALAQSMSSEAGRLALSPEELQEYFLVSGDIHSGPLTAIRFVGGVGLFFFIILSICLARCYWKLCRRVVNTQYWMAVAFMGIPWIWFPIKYIFLYGDYAHDAPLFIVGAGVYKLLEGVVREVES